MKLFCGCLSEYFSNNIACSRGPLTKLLWYWIEAHQCASLRLNSFRPLLRILTCQHQRPILNLSASISIPRLMGWLISPHFTTYNSLNGKSNVKWMHNIHSHNCGMNYCRFSYNYREKMKCEVRVYASRQRSEYSTISLRARILRLENQNVEVEEVLLVTQRVLVSCLHSLTLVGLEVLVLRDKYLQEQSWVHEIGNWDWLAPLAAEPTGKGWTTLVAWVLELDQKGSVGCWSSVGGSRAMPGTQRICWSSSKCFSTIVVYEKLQQTNKYKTTMSVSPWV